MTRPRILCISFSDISSDSRVLRQLDVLQEMGDVTTLSYGPKPDGVEGHLQIPMDLPSLPQTPVGVMNLALRRFRAVEFQAPAVKAALDLVQGHSFDIVVANEARALPLAYRVEGAPRIWCDLHEWAPEERTHVLSWRLLVAPFMDWLCARYLPRADATTTVNTSIARMYEERYGIEPEIVRNARPFVAALAPTPLAPGAIRLVHSGGAVPGRNIESIIDAVDLLGDGYTLDLFLIPSRQADAYWKQITARIANSPRTTLHDAVAPDDLPVALNPYDLGVYLLPPHTPNHRLMLPNKFFDFVQARLGFVFGPSTETDRLIIENGLGVVTAGYSATDLAEAIRALSREEIAGFKAATDAVAEEMSSDVDLEVERNILRRLQQPA
ncbi:glycosyltransferase [Microbacterium sp. NPDC057659]|uniref:glycosyltransferase n=1 Tax=Microbacterium sp. NPDC057659 TaxID=3346198 RepID=UPI00366DF5CC